MSVAGSPGTSRKSRKRRETVSHAWSGRRRSLRSA
jgi:hypothetical protein